ncbi:MAG: hypothetical protein WBA68_05460 [Alteraurantiacibacter sp.]
MRIIVCLALVALSTACMSKIDLPGSVLAPVEAPVAVADMGPPVDWRGVDVEMGRISDLAALEQLAKDFPDSSSVRLRLLNAKLEADNRAGALEDIRWLTDRGYRFSEGAEAQLTVMYDGIAATELERRFANDPPVMQASAVVAVLPASVRLPESVLYDPLHDRIFATSVVLRALYVREGQGAWREVPLRSPLNSVTGITLDAPRGLIWITSTVMDQTPGEPSEYNGMFALDRETLEIRRWLPAPGGAVLGDVAVAPDGSVFASDPVNGSIWSAGLGNSTLQAYIAQGTFRSPQGLAVSADNTRLYVSDYRYGLAQVMLRSRHVFRMRAAQPMLLDGVDGLWLDGNRLIALQNGLSPHRITEFKLGEGTGVIASARPLEVAHPAWTEPLGGSVSGGLLTYIGQGQWDIYGDGGTLRDGAFPRSTQIRRLQLVESAAESP